MPADAALILDNIALVHHLVRRLRRPAREYPDLVGVGMLALCVAGKYYHDDGRAKFTSYAYIAIRRHLRYHLSRQRSAISLESIAPWLAARPEPDSLEPAGIHETELKLSAMLTPRAR